MKISRYTTLLLILVLLTSCQVDNNAELENTNIALQNEIDELQQSNVELQSVIDNLSSNNTVNVKEDSLTLQKKIDELQQSNHELQSTIDDLLSNTNDLSPNTYGEFEITVVDYIDGVIKFVQKPTGFFQSLTLIGYDTSFFDEELEVLDYSNNSEYKAKYNVFGTLNNFNVYLAQWEEDNGYTKVKELCSLDTVTNQSVIVNTEEVQGHFQAVLISWEDKNGNIVEYILNSDGYGFSDFVVICEEYSRSVN